jgi:hypothetical protein
MNTKKHQEEIVTSPSCSFVSFRGEKNANPHIIEIGPVAGAGPSAAIKPIAYAFDRLKMLNASDVDPRNPCLTRLAGFPGSGRSQ